MALFDDLDPKGGTSLSTPTGSGLFDNIPEPPGPLASGFKAGVAGIKAAAGGIASMAGRGFGVRGLEQAGDRMTAEASQQASMYARRVEDVTSVGEGIEFAQYAVASALPSLLTMLAGATAGRVIGGVAARKVTEDATRRYIQTTGMAGGAVGTSMALEAGGIYPEAVKEGVDSPIARSIAGGVVAGALDVVPEFYLARKLGLLGGMKVGGVSGSRLTNAATQGGKAAVMEGVTEGAQTGVEKVAAGQSLTSPDAVSDFLNAVAVGSIAGGVMGAGVGAMQAPARAAEALPPAPAAVEEPPPPLPTIDLNAKYPSVPETPVEPPSPYGTINDEVTLPPELRTVDQVLADQRAPLAAAKESAAAKVAALEAEIAAPADQRQGRTKGRITKELMAARAELDAIASELRKVDNEIIGRDVANLRRAGWPRGRMTEGTLISLPEETVATDRPLQPPSIPVDLSDSQRQAFAVQTAPFERSAEKVANLQGVPLVELPEGSPQPAPQTPEIIVPDISTYESSRGIQKQGTPQQKQRSFIENSLQAVDAQTKGLVDSGAMDDKKAARIRGNISRELEKVFGGTQEPEQVRANIEQAIAKALKGRLNKADAETFTEGLLAQIASLPREFLSQGGIDTLPRVDSIERFPMGPGSIKPKVVAEGKVLYRETNQSGLDDLLRMDNQFDYQPIFVADNQDLALGQQGNKGIQVEFRPNALSGAENVKPGTGDLAGREYKIDIVAPRAVQAVTFPKKFNFKQLGYGSRVALSRFTRTELPDGRIRFERKGFDSRTAVNFTPEQQMQQGQEIIATLQRILGDPADLEVRLFEQRDPNSFAGRYRTTPVKDLIEIATNAKDTISVAAHEAFHRIEMKHLSGQERAILRRGLKKGTPLYERVMEAARRYDAANGTNIASEIEIVPQETRAYAFEMWRRGELEVQGPIKKIFAKIQQLLERVRNYLDGLGFRSVEDLFRAVDMGAFAQSGVNPLLTINADNVYSIIDTVMESNALVANKTAAWSPERIKSMIKVYGTSFNENTKAYVAMLSPQDFLNLTASEEVQRKIAAETDPLDLDQLAAEDQEIYLDVEVDKNNNFRVISHEGRHRMTALMRAGYERVPVAINTRSSAARTKLPMVRLSPQKNAVSSALAKDLIPLNVKYESDIQAAMTENEPSALFSRAALASSLTQVADFAKSGSAEPTQVISVFANAVDKLDLPMSTWRDLFGAYSDGFRGRLARFYNTYFSSGMNLARQSKGFANTFGAVTAYEQRKNRLIAEGVDVKLKTWQDGATTKQNIEKVSRALMARTVAGARVGTPEYEAAIAPLTSYERGMFDEATKMIADQLDAEFVADQRTMSAALGPETDAYKEWLENRTLQVQRLKDEGYVPERRFGEHVVYVTVPFVNDQGRETRITVLREQYESQSEATLQMKKLQDALGPDLQVQYGYRYSPEHDATLSYQQFLDTARRLGIELTQQEKERLAKATISADSVRRNRIFRRQNVAGYSEDGLRVLSEFAVTMANKIAYSEFSSAIADSQAGRPVSVTVDAESRPTIAVDDKTDLWEQDGPMSGFYRQRTDEMVDFVLQPQRGGEVSRNLRMAASLHFLGGSMAAAVVQASSLPMVSVPYLSQFANYTDVSAKVYSAVPLAWNPVLRDLAKLQDPNNRVAGVDAIEGLRDALLRAAKDGTTLDTEIYEIMGQSRGGVLAKSRNVRRAMEAWMYPFREAEKANRTATFVAAYRIGQEKNMQGDALYEFARNAVYNTQNRFDEANRAGIARNPIWAVLYTFKATPIFLTETIVALHKQNPQAAVFMLLSLAVAAGVNGLPFAEDLMDVIDTVAQRVFGSPFNSQRALRNILKNASEAIVGADLSGVLMNGIVNEITGLSFASRVGLGNLIPGTRMFAADTDYKRNAQEILGPVASQVIGGFEAIESLSKGDWVKAIRQGGPLAAQNAIKGVEQWTQGYAQDVGGRKLVDASGYEAILQAMGFSSRALNEAYALDRIDKQTLAFYQMVRSDFTNSIVGAVRENKPEKIEETLRAVNAWNQTHPDMPIALNASNIRRTVAEAGLPLNQRTLMTLPKQLRGSSEAYELTRSE